jgi:hypothetical protein
MTKERFEELITPIKEELIKAGDDFLFTVSDEEQKGVYSDAGLTDMTALTIIVLLISKHDITPDEIGREVIKLIKSKKAN